MLTNKVNSFLGPNFLITVDVMLWALSCTHVLQSERQLNSRIMIKLFRISTMYKDQERVCQKCFGGIFSRASEDRVTEGRG